MQHYLILLFYFDNFKSNLNVGSKGTEVEKLQECLAKYPDIYPEGKITGYFGKETKEAVIKFKEEFVPDVTGTGLVGKKTRAKLNELCFKTQEILPLEFSLITVGQPLLIEVANLLKNQWEALGAEIEIKTFDSATLEREIIKTRDYEALLFGEVLGLIPDPFPFWHSSQKKDPGLNLASYDSKKADKLLEGARTSLDSEIRAQKYENFQDILIEDCPIVFLYNPDYLYLVSEEIKGVEVKKIADPSKRFSNIGEWYIRTSRRFAPQEP